VSRFPAVPRGLRGRARREPRRSARRADLQGLRALAVLLVVFQHARVTGLRGGYVGVDVFFVLSGFLITGLLLARAKRDGSISFTDFYARRIRRILPAAMLTLVATELVAYFLLNFVRAKQVMLDGRWASLFAANIYFQHRATDYFAQGQPPSPVQHFWSLAVEEQFYLVWPALLSLVLFWLLVRRSRQAGHVTDHSLRRLALVVAALGLASLAWSVHDTEAEPSSAYFSTFTRGWELALGALLAVSFALWEHRTVRLPSRAQAVWRPVLGWLGLGMIMLAAVTFSSSTRFPGYSALLPTLGAVFVIAAGTGVERRRFDVGRVLSVAPATYVGDRSYAFYLWHWPFLVLAALYIGHNLSVMQNLLLLVAAFVISIVSYRFVERPIHESGWRKASSALVLPVSLAAALLVGFFAIHSLDATAARLDAASASGHTTASQHSMNAAPPPAQSVVKVATLPSVIAAVNAAKKSAPIPSALTPAVGHLLNDGYSWDASCSAHDGQTSNSICTLGAASSPVSIVLFGDSHSEMWMPAILPMANKDGWSVIPMSKSACTPEKWLDAKHWGECHAWYEWAVRKVKSLRPTVLLIAGCCGGFSGSDAQAVTASYISLANSMKHAAKKVVVLGDDVGLDSQPVDCLLSSGASMKKCTQVWPSDKFDFNTSLGSLAAKHGYSFVDTNGWFCYQDECPMVVGKTIVYVDVGHLTSEYVQSLAVPFRSAFRRAIGQ
jgi:peptidoglycan/LPS O-acetylase OafA/YrhL